jgi:hypothetical protein
MLGNLLLTNEHLADADHHIREFEKRHTDEKTREKFFGNMTTLCFHRDLWSRDESSINPYTEFREFCHTLLKHMRFITNNALCAYTMRLEHDSSFEEVPSVLGVCIDNIKDRLLDCEQLYRRTFITVNEPDYAVRQTTQLIYHVCDSQFTELINWYRQNYSSISRMLYKLDTYDNACEWEQDMFTIPMEYSQLQLMDAVESWIQNPFVGTPVDFVSPLRRMSMDEFEKKAPLIRAIQYLNENNTYDDVSGVFELCQGVYLCMDQTPAGQFDPYKMRVIFSAPYYDSDTISELDELDHNVLSFEKVSYPPVKRILKNTGIATMFWRDAKCEMLTAEWAINPQQATTFVNAFTINKLTTLLETHSEILKQLVMPNMLRPDSSTA